MDVRVKFLGAAQSVTGSKYLLQINNFKLLVDCGLFQGHKELRLRNWSSLPLQVSTIDAVVLTHAHIDHSGYLPRLTKEGYSGPVYCTNATASLLDIMLNDAAKLQEEEAEYAKKKGYSKHETPLPLFDMKDAEVALGMLESYPYKQEVEITDGVKVTFYDAGHILGSAIVELQLQGEKQEKTIVFSGDLGRYNQPLLHDPYPVKHADILFLESTYGDRLNPVQEVEQLLTSIVNSTFSRGGCLLVPAFAVGRTQLLLYYFHYLIEHKLIPSCNVYIDSPMAISATYLHKQHRKDHKLSVGKHEHESVFDDEHFKYYRSQESSINLNSIEQGAIIISASGMCTGGRVLHHLYHRLPNKNDTLLIVGYQAEGTRGRKILEGDETVRIFGIDVPVKCQVSHINGLSAHADQSELLKWASQLQGPPKMTFIVHGEVESSKQLAGKLSDQYEWPNVIVPAYLENFELFNGI